MGRFKTRLFKNSLGVQPTFLQLLTGLPPLHPVSFLSTESSDQGIDINFGVGVGRHVSRDWDKDESRQHNFCESQLQSYIKPSSATSLNPFDK
jgi:hypothetical protein